MLLVAALVAPKFLSIQVLPVMGLVTFTIAVGVPLQKTELAGYEKSKTVLFNTHVLFPIFRVKLAIPEFVGVPVICKLKIPFPLFKVPVLNVAVKPKTPVELIVWVS